MTLIPDLVQIAESAVLLCVGGSISIAWRNRGSRRRSVIRRCPWCRGHLSRWCRTCNGTGLVTNPRKKTR